MCVKTVYSMNKEDGPMVTLSWVNSRIGLKTATLIMKRTIPKMIKVRRLGGTVNVPGFSSQFRDAITDFFFQLVHQLTS